MTENPHFFENGGYLATFDDRFLKKSIENYPKKYVSTPDATTRSCHSLVSLVWNWLSKEDLGLIGTAKTSFLKRMLDMHLSSRNRLVYHMVGIPTLVEKARATLNLDETTEFAAFQNEHRQKQADVDASFFVTPAMQDDSWTASKIKNRHLLT